MELKFEKTDRGFTRSDFKDKYGKECSIQESSLATEHCIWLGCNEGVHVEGECCARMHLTQAHVAILIPVLKFFAENGYLPQRRCSECKLFHPKRKYEDGESRGDCPHSDYRNSDDGECGFFEEI